jgi:CheY-like chemotaxis protein
MSKKKILIVDDESSVRLMMIKILKSEKYQIDVAENGCQAIDRIWEKTYDLIVTDYSMPEMDGLMLMRAIKARYPDMPVLFVTGTESICDLLKEEGVTFLLKPFRILELKDKIEHMLTTIMA